MEYFIAVHALVACRFGTYLVCTTPQAELRGLTGDERVVLSVGTKLLSGLMLDQRKDADDLFTPLRPHMGDFIKGLKQRNQAA